MTDTNKREPSDAEVSAATGFGEPAETAEAEEATENNESEETSTEDTEGTSDDTSAEGDSKDEESSEKKDASDKDDDAESTDDEGSTDESKDEAEEADEDDSEESGDKDKGNRTVPYNLLKAKNKKIKELEGLLADKKKAEESSDTDESEDLDAQIEETSKELAKDLDIDEKGVAKILKAAGKLFGNKKVELPKEIVEKLKLLDKIESKDKQDKESTHFNKEWDGLNLKKLYPNAPQSAIEDAKKLMDELAHSKDHHKHDLDYILFKNKNQFETILKTAAKKKSGEQSKRLGENNAEESESETEENMVNIEDMTPDIMRKREQQDMAARRGASKVKDYQIHDVIRND